MVLYCRYGPSLTELQPFDHHLSYNLQSQDGTGRRGARSISLAPLAPVVRQLSNALPARQHDI
jgi:hypothetical protein